MDRDLLAVLRTNTNKLGPGEIKEAIKDMTSKIPLTLSGEYGTDLVSSSEGYKYLTNGRSKIGKVLDIYSLTSIINVLMQVVLERNRRVVIAIDELENLTTVTTSERLMINDYIRRLYDDNPRGLSLILIFTYDSYDDINIVIEPSIISRKRDVIEFSYPEEGDIEKYIKGCIEERASRKLNEVMESEVLKKIVKLLTSTLGKTITFRKINFEMHSIMRNIYEATGDHPQNFKITLKSFDEIYGKRTEELMNEVRKRQKKS